jgi:hypothetical protein
VEIHQSGTIPLLRTELEGSWARVYKHLTPNGVKSADFPAVFRFLNLTTQ